MNLRKILLILAMIIALIIGSVLLWKWWLLPIFIAGFIYVRIGWQMIIWRRKMASRIYKDIESSYRSSVDSIYLCGHVFLFPFSFFAMMFIYEIFKAEEVRRRKKEWFSKIIIARKKTSWFYKGFVIAFWLPLLIYGVAMATLLFICSMVLALLCLIFLILKKIIPFLIKFPRITHIQK